MTLALTREEFDIVREIVREFGPAWLFGSRVWGAPGPFADLDVALVNQPHQRGGLEILRERFDESRLSFVVDVSVLGQLPLAWQEKILTSGLRIE